MENAPDQPQDQDLSATPNAQQPDPSASESPAIPNWGGNFGNSMEPVYQDPDRAENQTAGPARGEFGAHGTGNTQGGYGNQFRADDIYSGQLGDQPVSSGGYRGGEPGRNTDSPEHMPHVGPPQHPEGMSHGTEPGTPLRGTTVDPTYRNDNDAPTGRDSGFSEDYGRSSLGGGGNQNGPSADPDHNPERRNQTEDSRPARPESNQPEGVAYRPAPVGSSGSEIHGRDEATVAGRSQDAQSGTGQEADADARTGYVKSDGESGNMGNTAEGIGSRGGSYNDPNDNMNPDAGAGSANQGDYQRAADNTAPAPPPASDGDDYMPPRRNAGRDTNTE